MWPDDPLEVLVGDGGYEMLATVRQAVTEAAAEWSVTDVDDLLLVVNELVTNGLDHGRSTVTVRCEHSEAGNIRVEVGDSGGERPEPTTAGIGDDHGRGLFLVEELSRDWGVRPDPSEVTVRAIVSPSR